MQRPKSDRAKPVRIHFKVNGSSPAEANRLTGELAELIENAVDDIVVSRARENAETQDAGTILVALLSAPAAIALAREPAIEFARGIADWLRKRRANISIGSDGSVAIENVAPDDVERIVRETLRAQR